MYISKVILKLVQPWVKTFLTESSLEPWKKMWLHHSKFWEKYDSNYGNGSLCYKTEGNMKCYLNNGILINIYMQTFMHLYMHICMHLGAYRRVGTLFCLGEDIFHIHPNLLQPLNLLILYFSSEFKQEKVNCYHWFKFLLTCLWLHCLKNTVPLFFFLFLPKCSILS